MLAPLDRVGIGRHLGRPLLNVLTEVAVLRRLGARFGRFERLAEQLGLHPSVVYIELLVDLVATPLHEPGQRVAISSPTSTAGMDRTGRVGRDELDVDGLTAPDVQPSE